MFLSFSFLSLLLFAKIYTIIDKNNLQPEDMDMMHSAELAFVVKLLDSYHVPLHIYDRSCVENFMFDFGLRRRIYKDVDYGKILEYILGSIKDKTLYRIEDAFKCRYLCFLIALSPLRQYSKRWNGLLSSIALLSRLTMFRSAKNNSE